MDTEQVQTAKDFVKIETISFEPIEHGVNHKSQTPMWAVIVNGVKCWAITDNIEGLIE